MGHKINPKVTKPRNGLVGEERCDYGQREINEDVGRETLEYIIKLHIKTVKNTFN